MDLDAVYLLKADIAEQKNQEYIQIYHQMVEKLNPSFLDPFADILLKHGNCKLVDHEKIIDATKQDLLKHLLACHEQFWEQSGVAHSICALEMLKEEFKSFENIDWNVQLRTPTARLRNVRMRIKQLYLQNLNKQLNHQSDILETITGDIVAQRAEINDLTNCRRNLKERMERCRQEIPALQEKLNENCTEVIESLERLHLPIETISDCNSDI